MTYDREHHHRQSIRLRSHDYAAGGTYFVTICTVDRACRFGEIRHGEMHVGTVGLIVEREWVRTGEIRPEVDIDVFAVMPNHLHGLLTIIPPDPTSAVRPPSVTDPTMCRAHSGVPLRSPRSLSSIIAQFKASSTRAINMTTGTAGTPIWQRGFYEHVVRDDVEFECIADYIVTNPERWETDTEHPKS